MSKFMIITSVYGAVGLLTCSAKVLRSAVISGHWQQMFFRNVILQKIWGACAKLPCTARHHEYPKISALPNVVCSVCLLPAVSNLG